MPKDLVHLLSRLGSLILESLERFLHGITVFADLIFALVDIVERHRYKQQLCLNGYAR